MGNILSHRVTTQRKNIIDYKISHNIMNELWYCQATNKHVIFLCYIDSQVNSLLQLDIVDSNSS